MTANEGATQATAPADPRDEATREAWELFWQMFQADKSRRWGILAELGLTSPMQGMALGALDPDKPLPMSSLAEALHCDNSNVTGIVDRLESAGLVERRPAPHDRRVKQLVLTLRGAAIRAQVHRRMGEPPPALAALSEEDAVALRDILRRALG
jgi:MarR family transcriptional regulator, organic hydroperoxide resistance regulator